MLQVGLGPCFCLNYAFEAEATGFFLSPLFISQYSIVKENFPLPSLFICLFYSHELTHFHYCVITHCFTLHVVVLPLNIPG